MYHPMLAFQLGIITPMILALSTFLNLVSPISNIDIRCIPLFAREARVRRRRKIFCDKWYTTYINIKYEVSVVSVTCAFVCAQERHSLILMLRS